MLAISLLPLVLLHARLGLSSCAHGTNLHRRAEIQDFDYGPVRGPLMWHGISPDNVLCATGLNQSPINIDSSIPVEQPGIIQIDVPRQDAQLINPGTNVEVVLSGTSIVGGREFELKQFHFHTPGEHPIEGKQFPGEIHMVHAAKDDPNVLAVIVILIQISSRRSMRSLERVSNDVHLIPEPGNSSPLPRLDISDLGAFVESSSFFHYTGSLTTPPCSEGVEFLIAQQPVPLRVEAYNAIHHAIGHNARPVQAAIPAQENVLQSAAKALGCEAFAPPPEETGAPPAEETAVPPEETAVPPEGEVVPPPEETAVPPEGEVVPPPEETAVPPEGEVPPPEETAAVPPPPEGEVVPPPEGEVVPPPEEAMVHPPPEEAVVPPEEVVPPPEGEVIPPPEAVEDDQGEDYLVEDDQGEDDLVEDDQGEDEGEVEDVVAPEEVVVAPPEAHPPPPPPHPAPVQAPPPAKPGNGKGQPPAHAWGRYRRY